MCCLASLLLAVLGLAAPGLVARDSLPGAYLLIAVLGGLATAYLVRRSRRRGGEWRSKPLLAVAVVAVAYAAVVSLVHYL